MQHLLIVLRKKNIFNTSRQVFTTFLRHQNIPSPVSYFRCYKKLGAGKVYGLVQCVAACFATLLKYVF